MPADRATAADAVMAAARTLVALTARSIEAAPVEVTMNQWAALVLLRDRTQPRMADLASALGLSPSSASRLVERLERKSLVARRASVASRREVTLDLTEAGIVLVDQVLDRRRAAIEQILDTIPAERWPEVRAGFETYAGAAGGPLGSTPDDRRIVGGAGGGGGQALSPEA